MLNYLDTKILSDILGCFENHIFLILIKKPMATLLGQVWGSMGYFLFYHLVTLLKIPRAEWSFH